MKKIAIAISIVLVNISVASSFKDYDLMEYKCNIKNASVVSPNGTKKYIDAKAMPNTKMLLVLKNNFFILNYHEKQFNSFSGEKDGFKIYKQNENNMMIDKNPNREKNKEILSYIFIQGSKIYVTYTCNPLK